MMKIKLMSMAALALSIPFTADAQMDKGTWMIGGNAAYSKLKDDRVPSINQSGYTFSENAIIGLSAGVAVKSNQIVGLTIGYAPGNLRYEALGPDSSRFVSHSKGHQKGGGLFYKVYRHLGNKFFFYGQATGWYSNGKYTTNQSDVKTNTASLSLSPGLSYQIFNNILLEIGIPSVLNIGYSKSRGDQAGITEDYYANTSLNSNPLENLSIGFKILLP